MIGDLLLIVAFLGAWALLGAYQARRNRRDDTMKGSDWKVRQNAFKWEMKQKGLK